MPLCKIVVSLYHTYCRKLKLTLLDKRFQSIEEIDSGCVTDWLELLIVGNVNMRAQIMSRKAQTDNQASVTEDLLIVAKDRIGKLGVKRRKCFRLLLAWLNDSNMDRIVGVARP